MTVTSPPPTPAGKALNISLRAVAIGWGLACLLLVSFSAVELSMMGFPDGHFTPYELATSGSRHILVSVCLAQSLYFICVGVIRKRVKAVRLCLQILIAAIFVVAPMMIIPSCAELQSCTRAYEWITDAPMDDGAGG